MIQSISMDEFLKQSSTLTVIDIRSNQSFNNNHIPGAINIPYEKLLVDPNHYLTQTKTYYLYCQKGISSKKIVSILNRMGYHAVHIMGGYEEWIMKK